MWKGPASRPFAFLNVLQLAKKIKLASRETCKSRGRAVFSGPASGDRNEAARKCSGCTWRMRESFHLVLAVAGLGVFLLALVEGEVSQVFMSLS